MGARFYADGVTARMPLWISLLAFAIRSPLGLSRSIAVENKAPAGPFGIFEGHNDIGAVIRPGKLDVEPAKQTYTINGSGENMWSTADAFHFVWKRMSGDIALEAEVAFRGMGKNPHRKACLLIRQSL